MPRTPSQISVQNHAVDSLISVFIQRVESIIWMCGVAPGAREPMQSCEIMWWWTKILSEIWKNLKQRIQHCSSLCCESHMADTTVFMKVERWCRITFPASGMNFGMLQIRSPDRGWNHYYGFWYSNAPPLGTIKSCLILVPKTNWFRTKLNHPKSPFMSNLCTYQVWS